MAQKYRKIDPRIWRDERFIKLTEGEKLVAIYCLTAQVNRCGIFTFSPAMAAEDLGTSTDTFAKRFGNVLRGLKWEWDSTLRVLYFPTWWKYNQPENINVLSGSMKDLADLPQTPLLAKFYANKTYLSKQFIATFEERSPNVTGTLPERPPIQEQEQEQEQDSFADASLGSQNTEPKPKAAAKEKASQKEKPPRPRNPIFDAIAEITGLDPATGTNGSNFGAIAARLAEQGYTADDVHKFGKEFTIHCGYAKNDNRRPYPNEIEKWIGKVRSTSGQLYTTQIYDEVP